MSYKESFFQQAVAEHQNGNLSAAEQGYRDVLRLDPDYPGALHQLGLIEFEHRNYNEAISLVEKSLRLDPGQLHWWMNYGNILKAINRTQEAETCYKKALQIDPHHSEANKALADLQAHPSQTADGKDRLNELHHLSQNLFRSGLTHESVLVYSALKELLSSNIVLNTNDIRVCAIKNLKEWSAGNGFELLRIMLDTNHPSPQYAMENSEDELPMLLSWEDSIKTYFSAPDVDFHVVRARNAIVSSFGWTLDYSSTIDQRYDLFSSSYDILVDDSHRVWLPFIEGKGIFRIVTKELSKMLVDFTGSRILPVKDPCVFIGSHENWGHWTSDFLTKIAAYEKLLDKSKFKLVFGPLKVNQRACLTHLGISPSQIIELEVLRGEAIRYQFDDLIYIPTVPKRPAFTYLRKRYAETVPDPSQFPERIYMSRRQETPRHRVFNIDEVENFFRNKGFLIIDNMKDLPTRDLIAILSNAQIIAMAPGAEFGNLAMCSKDTAVILLITDNHITRLHPDLQKAHNMANEYFFGINLPLVFAFGKPVKSKEAPLDGLADFNLDVLDRSIERALELRTRSL